MKNTAKTLLIVFATVVITGAVSKVTAPETRMGCVNIRNVIQQLPEFKAIMNQLDSTTKMYQQELMTKSTEYNTKLETFIKQSQKMDTLIRKQREKELEMLRTSIEEFRKTSDQTLRETEQKLFTPLFERTKDVVAAIAKEQGYTHIINEDASSQVLIFATPATRIDSLVLTKLKGR